jgi:hypothetical protein
MCVFASNLFYGTLTLKWCARMLAAAPTRANMFHEDTFSFGNLAIFFRNA